MAAAADAFDNVSNFNYALQLFAHNTFCDAAIAAIEELIPADLEKPENALKLRKNLEIYEGNTSYEKLMDAVVKIGVIHAQIFIGTFLKRYHISGTDLEKLQSFYLNYIANNPDHSLKNFIQKIFCMDTLLALDIAASLDENIIINGYLKIIGKVFDQAIAALETNDQKKLIIIMSNINRDADIIGFSNNTVHEFLATLTNELKLNSAKENRSKLVEYGRSKHVGLTMRRRIAVSTAAEIAKDVTANPGSTIQRSPTTDTVDLSGSGEVSDGASSKTNTNHNNSALAPSHASPVTEMTANPLSASSTTHTSPAASAESTHHLAASSKAATLKTVPIVNPKQGSCCFGFFRSRKIVPEATAAKYNS